MRTETMKVKIIKNLTVLDDGPVMDPATFNLPTEYIFHNICGSPFFFRIHSGKMNYAHATEQCSKDHPNATLPIPKSGRFSQNI